MLQKSNPESPIRLLDELQPRPLLSALAFGLLLGLTEVIFAVSVGNLIFSGEMAQFLSYGVGLSLVTASIMMIVISLGSSLPGMTAVLQFSPAVILAVIASTVVNLPGEIEMGERLLTVLAIISISSLLTGLFFWALGYFKLGGLVRFLPYPVIGGFLAGTGWLVVQKSFGVMADYPLNFANLPALLSADQIYLWGPGLLIAFVLYFASRRFTHSLVVPGILGISIILFYVGLPLAGISITDAMHRGLMLGSVSSAANWLPLPLQDLLGVDWLSVWEQSGNIAVILLVSVVSLLLNASAFEVVRNQDVDLNRELRVAGVANLLSGLGGGAVGYHALNLSTLGYRLGARGRLPWVAAGLVCLAVLFVGAPLIAYFPTPVLGALLFYMGLGFLVEWVIDGWSKLSRADYAVVILILIVIGATDFLIGVAVGLAAMVILFVMNYSRVNMVRHALTGAEMRSNVQRSTYHQRVLDELGRQVYILELEGFIFFGTANVLLEKIKARLEDTTDKQVRFIVVDFRRMTGLDTSAVISFVKVRQLTESEDVTLVFSQLSEESKRLFKANGLAEDQGGVQIFPDLDHSLEWCENQLLVSSMVTQVITPTTLRAQLSSGGFNKEDTGRLIKFLIKTQFEKGEYLIRQGEKAEDLYFIEYGEGTVYLEVEGGQRVRLRTIDAGTVVGELGLYLDGRRTASVVAATPIIAYRMTQTCLEKMKAEEPELATAFYEFIVRLLSERLVHITKFLEAVLK